MKKAVAMLLSVILLAVMIPMSVVSVGAATRTREEAVQWALNQVGVALDPDHMWGPQCVDLIFCYYEYLGVPSAGGYAYEYQWNNLPAGAGWERIPVVPGVTQLLPGDIGVWKPSYSYDVYYNTGVNGHVGIIIDSDSAGFMAVEQRAHASTLYTWFPLQVLNCVIRPKLEYIPEGLVSQTYRSHCKVRVTKNTTVKQYPCSPQTNAGSVDVETATIGDEYEAIEMVRNTATAKGNLWYKVKTKNGRTGFLFAGNTEFIGQLTSDVTLSGAVVPTTIIKGNDFAIGGTISAQYQTIKRVGAGVSTASGALAMWEIENVNGSSYSLSGSAIDSSMQFHRLNAGNYTYRVGVEVKTYYAKSATEEGTQASAYDLHNAAFYVDGNHKHNYTTYVYYWAAHPHYNCYQCACGDIAHNEAQPQYIASCEQCNPSVPTSGVYTDIDNGVYFLRCKGDGNYLSIANGTDADANPIHNYAFGNWDSQAFQISKTADGYEMRPLCSAARVLNVDASTVASGNQVNLFRRGHNATQWFKFEAVGDGYVIRNAQNTNVCLTPNGSGTVVAGYTGSSNQIWYLEKACTVSFNANGGSGVPAAIRVREGYAITIPTEQPTRKCRDFNFWVDSQSVGTKLLYGGDTFTVYEDVIISAMWSTARHTYSNCEDTSCNECGETRTEAGHSYDNACDVDCNECGFIRDDGGHTYDGHCDPCCSVCGAEREVRHSLVYMGTEVTCSYRKNLYTCWRCWSYSTEEIVYTDLNPHTYDDEQDADCNECGYLRQVPEHPAVICGDTSGDGKVNNRDLAMLQQYITGWVDTIDKNAADVNGDGKVNNRDLAMLQQYITGWIDTIDKNAAEVNDDDATNNRDLDPLEMYIHQWEPNWIQTIL